jgi:prepilin-type N-terminal cleavage/methylation domain-containing protein
MKRAFILIEILVVILIMGILSTIALPLYFKARQNTYDKEAWATLKIIKSAEKMRQIETTQYIACNGNTDCGQKLNLDLPVTSGWDYSVTVSGGFCAKAIGNRGTGNWHIDMDSEEAESGESCF